MSERLCCLGLSRRGVVTGTPMLWTSKLFAGPDTEERRDMLGWCSDGVREPGGVAAVSGVMTSEARRPTLCRHHHEALRHE